MRKSKGFKGLKETSQSNTHLRPVTTAPKPFVFVLMPIRDEFSDIYKFGIKGAAQDVGAYAERVDEQMFDEGILERIFNQISKADVIVADMTGRNPNVFYEVGYAHALNKVVLLLTQKADDIPFDLQQRSHIVYEGKIDKLRSTLTERLRWALEESNRRNIDQNDSYRFTLSMVGIEITEITIGLEPKTFHAEFNPNNNIELEFHIRNEGPEPSEPITHMYMFSSNQLTVGLPNIAWSYGTTTAVFPTTADLATVIRPSTLDRGKLGLDKQYRIEKTLPRIPVGAIERIDFSFKLNTLPEPPLTKFCLRLHSGLGVLDFPFSVEHFVKAAASTKPTEEKRPD
jgi:hypothetical protein